MIWMCLHGFVCTRNSAISCRGPLAPLVPLRKTLRKVRFRRVEDAVVSPDDRLRQRCVADALERFEFRSSHRPKRQRRKSQRGHPERSGEAWAEPKAERSETPTGLWGKPPSSAGSCTEQTRFRKTGAFSIGTPAENILLQMTAWLRAKNPQILEILRLSPRHHGPVASLQSAHDSPLRSG
jgi:hypothetical protein